MIPYIEAKLYRAPVLDCYDGVIVGDCMAAHMRAELCAGAFGLACRKKARGMILQSDRGSQFTSHLFRATLAKHDALQSMSGVGRCDDNARMESFFATLKKEKLYKMDTTKITATEAISVIVQYIAYYNLRRVYTTDGGWPPAVFRQKYVETSSAA